MYIILTNYNHKSLVDNVWGYVCRRGKLYWSQLLVFAPAFSIILLLPKGPAKNSYAYVPPRRFGLADCSLDFNDHFHPGFHYDSYLTYSYVFFPRCLLNLLLQGVKDFSVPVGLDAKVKVDLVVVGSVAVSEKGNC